MAMLIERTKLTLNCTSVEVCLKIHVIMNFNVVVILTVTMIVMVLMFQNSKRILEEAGTAIHAHPVHREIGASIPKQLDCF